MTDSHSWEEITALIKEEREFVVASHLLPDGDAIGATLGLGLILKKLNKNVFLPWTNNHLYIPGHFQFLPGLKLFRPSSDCPAKPANFIALDCGNAERLGALKECFRQAKNTVNIDHHRDNENFAKINMVEPKRAATSELIYLLAKKLGIELDKDIAISLYTGIVTDTGRFQYTNISAETFHIAADLLAYGVDPNYVFRNVYENQSFNAIKLFGHLLAQAELIKDIGVVYTTVTKKDLAQTKARVEDTENLIDHLRATKDIEVAVVFKEMDNMVRVSMRSTGQVDVGRIAELYGGGGHPLAAGYNSKKDLQSTKEELFQKIREWQE